MSASHFAISLARRARSASRSITPLSGSAATSPRTTSCTAPCGGASEKEISAIRARRWMNSDQCRARNIHLDAHRADRGDQIDHPADLGFGHLVVEAVVRRPGIERQHVVTRRPLFGGDAPQLFADEWHEWM